MPRCYWWRPPSDLWTKQSSLFCPLHSPTQPSTHRHTHTVTGDSPSQTNTGTDTHTHIHTHPRRLLIRTLSVGGALIQTTAHIPEPVYAYLEIIRRFNKTCVPSEGASCFPASLAITMRLLNSLKQHKLNNRRLPLRAPSRGWCGEPYRETEGWPTAQAIRTLWI